MPETEPSSVKDSTLTVTNNNNKQLAIASYGDLASPRSNGGESTNRLQAVSPTPSIFSNNSKVGNGVTNPSLTSSIALHKLDPLCLRSYCCCFGRKKKQLPLTPTSTGQQQQGKRNSANTTLPEKSEWKLGWLRFQEKVKKLVEHKWFDSCVLFLILSSSFVLVSPSCLIPSRYKKVG